LLAVLGIPFLTFWDAAVFSVLTGMTFGRVGCLLHGCCSGRPSLRWFAIELPDHRGVRRRRVPTQILEAAWSALLLAGAGILSNHRPFSGALFLFSAGGYAAGRLLLESTREEAAERRGWTVHHRISAALAALSAAGLALIARLP
jgi:prolipoprotein diacylglyceryltransferase